MAQLTEEELYNIKRKTIPFEDSIYGRSPLHKETSSTPKSYSEVEKFQQQQAFKQNYHNPKLKDIMGPATQILLSLMDSEHKE